MAQCGDPGHFMDGRTDHCEIEPVFAADVAVKHAADVETEIHIGGRKTPGGPALVHCGHSPASRESGGERRIRGAGARPPPRNSERAASAARPRSSAVKIASVPSPINLRTSPPCS